MTPRGRLKILLGYAAGVGKTYQMLTEAQALKREGVDVVIGYFEPHGRKDTIALTDGLEAATVSACPDCRCRVLAAVALADLLADGPPFPRSVELLELADDAPTLHLYVRDLRSACAHEHWLDPGFEEWAEVMADLADTPRLAR